MDTDLKKQASVLRAAKDLITTVTSERDQLAAKLAEKTAEMNQIKQRLEVEKIAAEMHEKGYHVETPFEDLVLNLEKEAEAGRLPTIKEAMKWAAPNMGARIGTINNDGHEGGGLSNFERYVVGEVG